MSIKVYSVKCPECKANLSIEEGRSQFFCSYCGAKIIINNENEHIYRHIDEAELIHAETDRVVELKRLEMEEKRREDEKKSKAFRVKLALVFLVACIVCVCLLYLFNSPIWIIIGCICFYALIFVGAEIISPNNDGDDDDD